MLLQQNICSRNPTKATSSHADRGYKISSYAAKKVNLCCAIHQIYARSNEQLKASILSPHIPNSH